MDLSLLKYFDIDPRVKEGILNGEPVVALESSIISHGMPYPQNLECAKMAEETVKQYGGIPATVGIYKGKIVIGMDDDQRHAISNEPGNPDAVAMKASIKGIPVAVAMKRNAGFTIAGIVRASSMAGIRIMATGGIGGVSRGGEVTMDVSADLREFGMSNMAVVSAGIKSILDIARTKEVLETNEVPVIGYKCDKMPAFFTPSSEFRIDYRLDTVEDIARMLDAKWSMGLNGCAIICNPVPAEFGMDPDIINGAIEQAVREAKEQGIAGEKNTPFLLGRVKAITGDASLKTNIEVIRNNAKVSAQLSVAYWNQFK